MFVRFELEKFLKSARIGHIDLNQDRLFVDLQKIQEIKFDHAYQDYALGGWQSCSLWNMTGDKDDGKSYEYDAPAQITEYGQALPYLKEIVTENFFMSACRSVRIFAIKNGSLMPHRDYLEFGRGFKRIHVVIQTNESCFNSEESLVYQMKQGEVWFVDGSPVHSAANFSNRWRYHLILDFDSRLEYEKIVIRGGCEELDSIHFVERPALDPLWLKGQASLGNGANELVINEMIPFLARMHFFYDVSSRDLFLWLEEIASQSGDASLIAFTKNISRKFIG